MRQYRLLSPVIKVAIVLFSPLFSIAQTGLVIDETRFAYPENQSSVSVELENTSDRDMSVEVAVSPDDAHRLVGTVGSLPSHSETILVVIPPLFILKPDKSTKTRINHVGDSLPVDRGSLLILDIATLPMSENSHLVKTDNQLQIAVRNRMKVFYRPSSLFGNPNMSYQKLRRTRENEIVTIHSPDPRYMTLYSLHVDGKAIDGDMVAPLSHRQQPQCKSQRTRGIAWQTLGICNNILPILKVKLNPSQLDVTSFAFSQ